MKKEVKGNRANRRTNNQPFSPAQLHSGFREIFSSFLKTTSQHYTLPERFDRQVGKDLGFYFIIHLFSVYIYTTSWNFEDRSLDLQANSMIIILTSN